MAVLTELTWLSKHFGISAADLKLGHGDTPGSVTDRLHRGSYTFVMARVPINDFEKANLLERAGFVLRDVRLILNVDLTRPTPPPAVSGLESSEYRTADLPALRRIARGSFLTGHFRSDRKFAKAEVDEMYVLWVDKSVRNRYHIFVARDGDKPVGFVAASGQEGRFSIELVAVDSKYQKSGVGRDILAVSLQQAKKEFKVGEVAVHLENVHAIRLYERAGFRLEKGEITFHWWRA